MVKLSAQRDSEKDLNQTVEMTEPARVAPECPICGGSDTEVYTTRGSVRYCRCRKVDCSARFKVSRGNSSQIQLAGECPTSKTHDQTRVYKTSGGNNLCICDDCGATWSQTVGVTVAKRKG